MPLWTKALYTAVLDAEQYLLKIQWKSADFSMQEAGSKELERAGKMVEVRSAGADDAPTIARILAHAFPSLYHSAFGTRDAELSEALLKALYSAGSLSLETTRVAVYEEHVVGVAILHTGGPIGQGSLGAYWYAVSSSLPGWRVLRAFAGGLTANWMLNGRIPRSKDLIYIEALAVAENERGNGIGSRLLKDASAWARERQRSRLALHVLVSNAGARRLYERFGFRPSHSSAGSSWLQGLQRSSDWGAILMEKRI